MAAQGPRGAARDRTVRDGAFARFSAVSLGSTAVTLAAVAALADVPGLAGAPAAALATVCGFAVSYPMSRGWAFRTGAGERHAAALLWLGGLSVVGLILTGAAGALVAAVAARMEVASPLSLALEEAVEAAVLGILFVVRYAVSRTLFAVADEHPG